MPRRRKYILLRIEVINEKYYKRILTLTYNGNEIILQHITSDFRNNEFYEYAHQWNYKKGGEKEAYKHYELIKKGYFGKAESIL